MFVKVKALRRVVLDRVINAGDVVDMHVALARLLYLSGHVKTHVETPEPSEPVEQPVTARRGRPRKEA
jgi:hypothetical protein